MKAAAVIVAASWVALGGCGNGVRPNWPPSYHHDTMHLGIMKREAGARSAALAGAGRAAGVSAEGAIANPAALTNVKKGTLSAGAGYILSDMVIQPTAEEPQAQSFFGSWSPAYIAGARRVGGGPVVLAATLWQPYDYKYATDGGVTGRGGLYAAGPTASWALGGFCFGVAGEYLFGSLQLNGDRVFPAFDGRRLSGYSGRAAIARTFFGGRGWSLTGTVVGYYGGRVSATGPNSYRVELPDAVVPAFALRAGGIAVYGDYMYQFTAGMRADEVYIDDVIRAFGRDVGWASLGAEYTTAGGAVARGGVSYRPWYVADASRRAVHGWYYGIGGGWLTAGERGRWDAALEYGRRGARDDAGYVVGDIAILLSYNYWW